MLLSIIGDILGSDGGESDSSSGGSGGIEGELAGSMSEEELLPGSSSGTDTDGADSMDDGMGVGGDVASDDAMDDVFGDDSGGDDDFLDGGDGEMGDMGGGGEMSIDGMDEGDGGVSSEIEARVEEMENDVGSLSSTVNTVQSENEKISESLDDIEENIRKLLEVYEMVTQGVNPFVEEDSLNDTFGAGAGGAAGSGDFGGQSLFDADTEEEEESMDEDVAEADAEEFLDESIIDGEDDEDDEDEFGMGDGDEFEMDDEDDLGLEDDAEDTDGGSADGDLSFDDLKDEYESGDADWDGDDENVAPDEERELEDDGFEDDDLDAGDDELLEDDLETGDELDVDDDLETEDVSLEDDAPSLAADDDDEMVAGDAVTDATIPWDDGGRPYLEEVPAEYETEFVVMDWLDYLVGEAGLDGAAETLRFYGTIHWIDDSVEDYLQTILNGFHGGPDIDDPEPRSGLGVDHTRSLWRLAQISTPKKKRRSYEAWLEAETADGQVDADGDLQINADGNEPPVADASAEESSDDPTADHSRGEQLTYAEPGVDADGVASSGDTDSGTDPLESAGEDGVTAGEATLEDVDDSDQSMADDGAHKIVIDDADGSEIGDAESIESDTDAPHQDDSDVPDSRVDDRGQMIWVDSNVVLSDSGVQLQQTGPASADAVDQTAAGHGGDVQQPASGHSDQPASGHGGDVQQTVSDHGGEVERVKSMLEHDGGDPAADDGYVKPLVVSDDHADLEPWQVDIIRSLFAPETDGGPYGR